MVDLTSVAVVTGGSSGLGLACARRLARHHLVVLADVNVARLNEAADELRMAGGQVTPFVVDVTKPDEVAGLAKITQSLGQFAALVNAAGVSPSMTDGRRVMEVNLVGTALVERAFLDLAREGSAAVLIASSAGHMVPIGSPLDLDVSRPLADDFWTRAAAGSKNSGDAYSVSKRGVLAYCEAVAPEWGARGARISTISPGVIRTPMSELEFARQPLMQNMIPMTPLQRWGDPDEIAAVAEFLLSRAASFITGSDIKVDGGVTAVALRMAS